jgi:hypothetical protein
MIERNIFLEDHNHVLDGSIGMRIAVILGPSWARYSESHGPNRQGRQQPSTLRFHSISPRFESRLGFAFTFGNSRDVDTLSLLGRNDN